MQQKLIALLEKAGPAHHQAFLATNGDDPEWPLWYANYLRSDISELLSYEMTQSELTCWLFLADKEHRQKAPDTHWPTYYAHFLMQNLKN